MNEETIIDRTREIAKKELVKSDFLLSVLDDSEYFIFIAASIRDSLKNLAPDVPGWEPFQSHANPVQALYAFRDENGMNLGISLTNLYIHEQRPSDGTGQLAITSHEALFDSFILPEASMSYDWLQYNHKEYILPGVLVTCQLSISVPDSVKVFLRKMGKVEDSVVSGVSSSIKCDIF